MYVGEIVQLDKGFLEAKKHDYAYVYDQYKLSEKPGISIITEEGVDLGGFSDEEYNEYLIPVGDSGVRYDFTNVIQVDRDFRTVIKPAIVKFLKREGLLKE